MGVFGTIVEPFVLSMRNARQDVLLGCAIARQLIGDHHAWDVLATLAQLSEELLRCCFVPTALYHDIEHVPMLIDRTPARVLFGIDGEEDFVQMPLVARLRPPPPQLIGILLAKFQAPLTNGFIGQHNTTGRHHLCDITIAERKAEIAPDGVADDLGREAITRVGARIG